MERKEISQYLYELENLADELLIMLLSLGAIGVTGFVIFSSNQDWSLYEFGEAIYPWIVMLGLMVIGRELWLLNRKLTHYMKQENEQGD